MEYSNEPAVHIQAAAVLEAQQNALAEAVVERHYTYVPALATRYGDAGRAKCVQDAHFHLNYLREAVTARSLPLFEDYIRWAQTMLEGRNIPAEDLAVHLDCLAEVFDEMVPPSIASLLSEYVQTGLEVLRGCATVEPPEVTTHVLDPLAQSYLDALLRGQRQEAAGLVVNAAKEGTPVRDLYLQVFQKTQYEVGRLWQSNQINVAQEHFCTAATQHIMAQLYPYIFNNNRKGRTLVMVCASNELHEVGARMVGDFFEMDGWDTYYLGANMPTDSILAAVEERQADVLGISVTITFHVPRVVEIIETIRQHPSTANVRILVGGYPFRVDPALWKTVGADGFASSADEAVMLAERLLEA